MNRKQSEKGRVWYIGGRRRRTRGQKDKEDFCQ